MGRFVLSVGCGNYSNGDRLPGAINDAKEFFTVMLDDRLGGASSTRSKRLLDPTTPELLEEISLFLSGLASFDEYFLFFAGHAHRSRTGYNFRCRDTPPHSAFDSVSWRELKVLIGKTDARGTLIFDTCHSGAIKGLDAYSTRGDDDEESPPPDAPREGTIVIWSCDAKEKAYENEKHGIFSEYFLEGIRSGANAPTNAGFVTAGKLVSYVVERIVANGHKVSIPKSQNSGDTAGMFIAKNPRYFANSTNSPVPIPHSTDDNRTSISRRSCDGIIELAKSILRGETKLSHRRSTISHSLQANLFFVPAINSEVYFSQSENSTVLVTENGIYHSSTLKSIAILWEAVDNVETYKSSFGSTLSSSKHEDVTLNFRAIVAAQQKEKNYRIRDSEHPSLALAIEWGRIYKKSGWKWHVVPPKPPVCGREVAIFAPVTYDSMRTIPASTSDAIEINRILRGTVPPFNPATAFEFKTSLREVFRSAHHKTLILYYSGHGIVLDGELFLTARFSHPNLALETALPVFKLSDLMAEYQVINLVLLLDCCYSGRAGDNLGLSFDALNPSLQTFFEEDQVGITIIASSGRSEESFDTPRLSIFTEALIKAWSSLRSQKPPLTVGALITSLHNTGTSNVAQRMRVFVSEQGEDVVLADDLQDSVNLELAQIAARTDSKADQMRKLKQIDLRLLEGNQFPTEHVQLFRKPPVSLLSRVAIILVGVIGFAFFSIPSCIGLWREHYRFWAVLVAFIWSIAWVTPVWVGVTETDKDHYMILGDIGVLIREGSNLHVLPAQSLMSVQVSKSHSSYAGFQGSVSETKRTNHLLIRDQGEPVELPGWLQNLDQVLIRINEIIAAAGITPVRPAGSTN